VKLEDFYRPVEELSDRELVEQYAVLKRVQERRRRRAADDEGAERQAAEDATVRRLLDSIDE
jgi:hypothetical protein